MTEEKKYIQVEDLLPDGETIIRVKKHPEFEDRKPIPGSHRTGTYKSGSGQWYMYDTKLKNKEGEEVWITIFANDENKSAFDTGFIKANVVPKRDGKSKEEIFDKDGKKLLKTFYNPLSEVELKMAKDKLIKEYKENSGEEKAVSPEDAVSGMEKKEPTKDINISEIPF